MVELQAAFAILKALVPPVSVIASIDAGAAPTPVTVTVITPRAPSAASTLGEEAETLALGASPSGMAFVMSCVVVAAVRLVPNAISPNRAVLSQVTSAPQEMT